MTRWLYRLWLHLLRRKPRAMTSAERERGWRYIEGVDDGAGTLRVKTEDTAMKGGGDG